VSWSIDGEYARCGALAIDGLTHGFGLRSAPPPLNLAATLKQVHGDTVLRAAEAAPGVAADGIWESRARLDGRLLAVRTADCVPILLADRKASRVAAIHSGWRGTAAKIVLRAVEQLVAAGSPATELVAAVGPSIGPCCYPVSEPVAAALAQASGAPIVASGADLGEAIRWQLRTAGVPEESIHRAPWCTCCEGGRFHSHRRDGAEAGRQWSLIGPSGALP
jgi:YfiH family protein